MKKTFKKLPWLLVSGLLLVACTHSEDISENENLLDTLVTGTTDNIEEFIDFPSNIRMILPTQYRKEGTGYPRDVEGNSWLEFYKDKKSKQWKIGEAKLNTSYGFDECVGLDIMIIKSQHENAIFFFTPFSGLSEELVTLIEDKNLYPTQQLDILLNGQKFEFSAQGNVLNEETGKPFTQDEIKERSEADWVGSTIQEYSIQYTTNEGVFSLVKIPLLEGSDPNIVWIGDMNGDGIPDLILNAPSFYEGEHTYFFLSDPTDKDEPIKMVSEAEVMNDC